MRERGAGGGGVSGVFPGFLAIFSVLARRKVSFYRVGRLGYSSADPV